MTADYVRLVGQRDRAKQENRDLRIENAHLKRALNRAQTRLETGRRKRDLLNREIRRLKARPPVIAPFTLTEFHAWWLARHTPEELALIAGELVEND